MPLGLHGFQVSQYYQAMLRGKGPHVLCMAFIFALLAPAWGVAVESGEHQAIAVDLHDLKQSASAFEFVGNLIKTADGHCLTVAAPVEGASVLTQQCEGSLAQLWTYQSRSGQMLHAGLCLDAGPVGEVFLQACEHGLSKQSWAFETETGHLRNRDGFCVETSGHRDDVVFAQACGWAATDRAASLMARLGPPEGSRTTTTTTTSTSRKKIFPIPTVPRTTTTRRTTTPTIKLPPTTTSSSTTLFVTTNMDLLKLRTTLPPVGACLDSVDTGIRFRGGERATCADLVNYCEHPHLGYKIKVACAKTCGRCDLSTLGALYMHCRDRDQNTTPIITIRGAPQVCTDLKEFCTGHPDSEYVLRKCPATCLFCHPEPTTTTRILYEFSTSFVEATAGGLGCDRRRRFGFCNTRRRRGL